MTIAELFQRAKDTLYPLASRLSSTKLFMAMAFSVWCYEAYATKLTEMVQWLYVAVAGVVVSFFMLGRGIHDAAKARADADVEIERIRKGQV
jgi:cation transport ATPase